LLNAFGAESITAETTRSALALLGVEQFDLIVSDISREDQTDEGIRALPLMRQVAPRTPVIFYVGNLSRANAPTGSFGITNQPNDLLHLILDMVERARV
jgi:DNA-binding NtrC family response regulator